jgi:hypothetical protein
MVVRGKSRCGLRPAGFTVNPVLWDATRRAGALAVAAEGGGYLPVGQRWLSREGGRSGQSKVR